MNGDAPCKLADPTFHAGPAESWRRPSVCRAAWLQAVLASILMLATLPGRTQGLGLVTEPLLADLHFDRTTYASINLWATLLGSLFCIPVGWAIERAGLRRATAGIVLLFGLAVWQFSAATGGIMMVFLLLLATRALGQSALSMCSIVTVGRWFPGRASFAMGVYSVLLSLWFALAFGVIGWSMRVNGWRTAWLQIALALLFVIMPITVLALREPRPAEVSGNRSGENNTSLLNGRAHDGFTLSQALHTGAFWLFAGSAAAFNLVSSGLGLFNEAVLAERGFDRQTFHLFLAVSALMSLCGQFMGGWLSQRYRYQTLTFLALLLYATGLILIPFIGHSWQLWCLAALLGAAGGMTIVIFFSVWSDLFGQRQLGRIQGAAQMITVLASGLGPLVFARCEALFGSYTPILVLLAGIVLALALVSRCVRTPSVDIGLNEGGRT